MFLCMDIYIYTYAWIYTYTYELFLNQRSGCWSVWHQHRVPLKRYEMRGFEISLWTAGQLLWFFGYVDFILMSCGFSTNDVFPSGLGTGHVSKSNEHKNFQSILRSTMSHDECLRNNRMQFLVAQNSGPFLESSAGFPKISQVCWWWCHERLISYQITWYSILYLISYDIISYHIRSYDML